MEKHLEKWVQVFGNKTYGFDFASNLIIKSEFKTNKEFSWDIDYYNYEDDETFIASEDLINKRNKAPIFVYNGIKYFVTKSPDYTYAIINQNKLSDFSNPFNYDLIAINKIENWELEKRETILLTIVYQKMNKKINDIFISLINSFVLKQLKTNFFKLDNSSEFKTKIIYQLDLNEIRYGELIKIMLILPMIIKIILFRLNKKFNNIWLYEELNENNYFNIFIFKNTNLEKDIWEENENKLVNLVETFESKVLLNEELVHEFIHHKIDGNKFNKLYEFNNGTIYFFNSTSSKFINYFSTIKKI